MRLDALFSFPAERTAFSDEFYAALGRAGAFCPLFERNCDAAAWYVELSRIARRAVTASPRTSRLRRSLLNAP